MQQHNSKHFARRRPPPPPLKGSTGQNSTFSEHGRDAYQIKWSHECSNMLVNVLPADPLPPPTRTLGGRFQKSTFSEHGHVASKLNAITKYSK